MKKISVLVFVLLLFMLCSCQKKETVINGFSMDAPYSIKTKNHDKEKIQTVREYLKECDSLFDAYDDSSSLGKLNLNKKMTVSDENRELYKLIKEVYPYCDEYFDISVRRLTELWDFNSDNPEVPANDKIKEALKATGFEKIVISDDGISLKNNCSIELGAVAKGYAADSVFSLLNDDSAVIDIGGTVISSVSEKIKVGVKNPDGEGLLCSFYLDYGEAVSTSGSYERYFVKDGKKYTHILDPKTGESVDNGLMSVTVITDSALKADILSTRLFVRGLSDSVEYENTKVIYVTDDKKVYVKGDFTISDLNTEYKLQEN